MTKSKVDIVNNTLSIRDGDQIAVASPAWFTWLDNASIFYYHCDQSTFTARKQPRRGKMYWYAYARQSSVLRCVYIGRSEDLTTECLQAVVERFRIETDSGAASVTANVFGAHSRAVQQTAALLEQLYGGQGMLNVPIADEQLRNLQTLVQQNRRLSAQAACYALDFLATALDALQTNSQNASRERESLLQEVWRLRATLPLTTPSPSGTGTHNEIF